MSDINKLIDELDIVFADLKNGDLKPKVACEMNNAAGKIINACKLQLEYAKVNGTKAKIKYLDA